MKINSSISRCLKSDFKVYNQIDGTSFELRWGKEDEVERVSVFNEETGEHEFTGEVKETDWCTYESGVFKAKATQSVIDTIFVKGHRLPKMEELKAIGEILGMTEERMLAWMKGHLLNTIAKYDKSENVEDFTINGVHLWLDSEMRSKVKENLDYCQVMGIDNTTLRYNGMAFPLSLELGWQLYYAVLGYARDTWDVTETHNATIPTLETIDDVIAYEGTFKDAYPEKLVF